MLNLRESKWLKIVAIVTVLAFVPVQTSWAGRGRRGGNSTSALIVAAIGGAAMPLTCYFAGPNATYAMLVGSVASAAMTKAGCDPQVTTLVSAAASGATYAGFTTGFALNSAMIHTVVKRIVAAEVTYELSKSEGSRWYAGMVGQAAGYAAGAGMEGLYGNVEGFNGYKEYLPEFSARLLISGGISSLIRYAILPSLVGEDSLALRMYGGDIASLGGSLAEGTSEEFGILPVRDNYGVAQRFSSSEFEQVGGEMKASPEEEYRYEEEGGRHGLVWYDKKEKEFVKTVKDKSGNYWTYRYKISDQMDRWRARDLRDMANRGYKFIIDPTKNQWLALYKYDPRPQFVGQDQGRLVKDRGVTSASSPWEYSRNFEKDETKMVQERYVEPQKGETFTLKYNKVPFSDKVKDTEMSGDGAQRLYEEYRQMKSEMPLSTGQTFMREGIQGLLFGDVFQKQWETESSPGEESIRFEN